MRILVQDFSGHPFQAQLSRALAARGHEVLHTTCGGYASGHGALEVQPGDPATLRFATIDLADGFQKYSFRKRLRQELVYGWRLARMIRKVDPDVFVSCNEPLLAKAVVGTSCWLTRRRWVFWVQDLYSVAMRRHLAKVLRWPGDLLGRGFEVIERWLVRRADGVVLISHAFEDWLIDHHIRPANAAVIPNWAPLDELPYYPDDERWFHERFDLPDSASVALYSGTLGHKHDASLFEVLAERLQAVGGHVVVISEGPAADLLSEAAATRLPNLHVLPFQPWSEVPRILASASVLTAVLAPEAATYSVPSKVLTYLCAGRPIVASMSPDNLAAGHLREADAGIVTDPDDAEGFAEAIVRLVGDRTERRRLGKNARHFAEQAFDIERITDRFVEVLDPSAVPSVIVAPNVVATAVPPVHARNAAR